MLCFCMSMVFCLFLVCSDLSPNQEAYRHIQEQTQRHLDSYARDGLRTLCIAKKVTLTIDAHQCFSDI